MARLFSLKDWFEESTLGPSILVLDGGVSTHLEHILSQKNQLFPIDPFGVRHCY